MTMVERAGAAVRKFWAGATGEGDAFVAHSADDIARAALLAALDAEDIALREALLPFMGGDTAVDASENARAAILALKSLAQGA